MKYFKNTELAKLYNVSEKSVRNWIEAAQTGKLDLQLFDNNGKWQIANTAKNSHTIEKLAEKGKKFRNTRGSKSVRPTKAFYDYFSTKEVFDLAADLEIHREIDQKYSYFAEGAQAWDAYVRRMSTEAFPNLFNNTVGLLDLSQEFIDRRLEGYSGINVVDIGVGNAMPVKQLLGHLLDKKILRRYIAIDTSNAMIDVAEKNIKEWFGDKVPMERYIRDVNYEKFDDLLAGDTFTEGEHRVANLVVYLGSGIANMRDPDFALRTIYNSLGKDDVFVLSRRLDTPQVRRFFDLGDTTQNSKLGDRQKTIVEMLGIDDSFFTVEQFFDEEHMRRVVQIRLNVDLSIHFELNGKKRVVEIHKDEAIILWHASHAGLMHVVEQFENNGFSVLQTSKSQDDQYLQIVSKIKTDIND